MDPEDLRRLLTPPLAMAFWGVVIAVLGARRKKPTHGGATSTEKARNVGYFLGRKVRGLWNYGIGRHLRS